MNYSLATVELRVAGTRPLRYARRTFGDLTSSHIN
jgi:hypothetical protein